MKNILSKTITFLLLCALFISCTPTIYAADEIKITVNGMSVNADQPPVIINGTTLVPIRAVAEELGCSVLWEEDTRQVYVRNSKVIVAMQIDNLYVSVKRATNPDVAETITLNVPPQIIGERTCLPVRAVAEAFGAKVEWNDNSNTVIITHEPGEKFIAVSGGEYHTVAIKENGELWHWGWGYDNKSPRKMLENTVKASAGLSYTMAIKKDSTLWAWGVNYSGQIGDGTTEYKSDFVKIMDNVASVSSRYNSTMAIKTDGSLWAWGNNVSGSLGDGTYIDKHSPIKIMENVSSVSAGHFYTMAIKTDGTLWAWGSNDYGQLGNGDGGIGKASTKPIKVMDNVLSVCAGGSYTMAIKTDGSLWALGLSGDGTPIKIMENVVSVSVGRAHTMAIKENGELWCWGRNYSGQIGNGTTASLFEESEKNPVKIMDNVAFISAGLHHSMAIKTNGELWAWGDNSHGQLSEGEMSKDRYSFDLGADKSRPRKIFVIE